MDKQQDKLLAGFSPVTANEWEAKIREDLKGADYEKKLIKKTLDNLSIKPYYTAEDMGPMQYLNQVPGKFPFLRGGKTNGNNWEIRQDFKVDDVDTAVQKARQAAERGVTSVGFDLTGKGDLYYHDFRKLIMAIDRQTTSFNLIAGESSPVMIDFLLKALEEMNYKGTLKGSLDFDPLGNLTLTGGFFRSESDDFSDASTLMLTAENELPDFRVLAVNSHLFSDSGASPVQELAFGLSMMAEYFVRLTDQKHHVGDIARHLQWNLGVGSDYFMEIAKVRAARLLFSTMVSAFDPTVAPQAQVFIHSITTSWNKTVYDAHVNMLRLTTEAMAAILGGCNSLLVKPYDSSHKEQGEFSERNARNMQNILKEESYFDKVVDPAAGSYYLETLTHLLVDNAWNLFLKVDEKGGYVEAFKSGFIQDEVKKMTNRRLDMVASRREILLGTNQFPNAAENVNMELTNEQFPEPQEKPYRIAEPLLAARAAEGFEKLRQSTEKRQGPCPKVFMLTYGNPAMRLARAQFSVNFFACAGYEVIDNFGFGSAKEGVDAAFKAKADIIVVCSSDEEYTEIAPAVAEMVKGKAIVVVAGAPANMEELRQKGINEFIHIRSNVLETLQGFHTRLEII